MSIQKQKKIANFALLMGLIIALYGFILQVQPVRDDGIVITIMSRILIIMINFPGGLKDFFR